MMPKSKANSKVVVGQEKLLFNAPEVSYFIACLVMVNQLRGLARACESGEIPKGAFMGKANEVLSRLTETVAATEQFDIVLPVMDCGQFSPFFWRWFNWWDDYFEGLTPMQVGEIERLGREQDSALEDYRPRGNWLSHRHTPAFIPLMT
jgi:hypothetical protein